MSEAGQASCGAVRQASVHKAGSQLTLAANGCVVKLRGL